MMKDDYLEAMREAGFNQVKIIDETSFPIDCMDNDPTAKVIIKEINLPADKIKEAASSVVSIKVQGIKPG